MSNKKPTDELPERFVDETDDALTIPVDSLRGAVDYSVKIWTEAGKHGSTQITEVVLFRDRFYSFSYFRSYNHGISEDAGNFHPAILTPVEPVEITTIEWRKPMP